MAHKHPFNTICKILYCCAVLLPATSLMSAEERTKDRDFNQLAIKNWEDGTERPKVEDNRDNITTEPQNSKNADKSIMENSLASNIADKKTRIEWKPKWYFDGAGSVRIASPVISADKSVIALIETAGKSVGPFASRIVLLNAAAKTGLPCLRIIELPETRINNLLLIPASSMALAIAEPQACFKQSLRVIAIDLISGERKSMTPPVSGNITGLAATEDIVALKTSESNQIFLFNPDDLSQKNGSMTSSFNGGSLTFTSDHKYLTSAGNGKVEFFNLENKSVTVDHEIKLPEKISPKKIVFCNPKGTSFVIISTEHSAGWYNNNTFKPFGRKTGNIIIYDAENQVIVLETAVKNALEFYKFPEMKLLSSTTPKEMRPAHTGEPLAVLPFRDSYLEIDDHGNFTFLYKIKQRWQKDIILSAFK